MTHWLTIQIRVPAHTQPKAALAAPGTKLEDAAPDPTYRVARRELATLLSAVDRTVTMYGYKARDLGASVGGKVEST